ncbi:hypothetical protein TNCV_4253221 [Trichonephila clavipes]|nr:hypothetical protein TNCV_4253221 [Trichonephila clavipes]
MVLKDNDRRTSCPCHDEFRGPRSDYVRQMSSHKSCSEVGKRWVALDNPRLLSLKIELELTHIVQSPVSCSELRLTTGVDLALCRDEFRGPQSATVRQVA